MKKFLILIVGFYQVFVSSILKNILGVNKFCRFSPTCSEYAKTAIKEKGVFHGVYKSAARILKCQPFSSVS